MTMMMVLVVEVMMMIMMVMKMMGNRMSTKGSQTNGEKEMKIVILMLYEK